MDFSYSYLIVGWLIVFCLILAFKLKKKGYQEKKKKGVVILASEMMIASTQSLPDAVTTLREVGIWISMLSPTYLFLPLFFWDVDDVGLIASSLTTLGKGHESLFKNDKGYHQIAELLVSRSRRNRAQALGVLASISGKDPRVAEILVAEFERLARS